MLIGSFPRSVRARHIVDTYLSELDNFVVETLKRTGVPGLSIAIVYKDQVVYLIGSGMEAGRSKPVDPDTVFQLASV